MSQAMSSMAMPSFDSYGQESPDGVGRSTKPRQKKKKSGKTGD